MKIFDFILEYDDYIKNINNSSLIKDEKIYNDFKNTIIIEGLIKTYPNDKSLNVILRKFSELKGEIEEDGEIYLEGDFTELSNYLPLINNLGYFISKLTINGNNWIKDFDDNTKPIALFLEPKYDVEISIKPSFLYHATPLKNKNSILKYDMIPKSQSKISNHPERIYLTKEYKMVYMFGMTFNEPFIICKIDTNELDIKLYRDVNASSNSYYTMDNIKKENIEIIYNSL